MSIQGTNPLRGLVLPSRDTWKQTITPQMRRTLVLVSRKPQLIVQLHSCHEASLHRKKDWAGQNNWRTSEGPPNHKLLVPNSNSCPFPFQLYGNSKANPMTMQGTLAFKTSLLKFTAWHEPSPLCSRWHWSVLPVSQVAEWPREHWLSRSLLCYGGWGQVPILGDAADHGCPLPTTNACYLKPTCVSH